MANYRIVINSETKDKSPFVYEFGNTKDIVLHIGSGKCTLFFSVGKEYELDEFLNPQSYLFRVFRDAMRKAYLLHALRYDKGLIVKKITFYTDGSSKAYAKNDHPQFPFVYSMIGEKLLELPELWKSADFIRNAVDITKSQADTDYRFASLSSFLASYQKSYVIDEFAALWTSMNAYYNHIAKLFDVQYKEALAKGEATKNIKLLGNDKNSLGALMSLYQDGVQKASKKETEAQFKGFCDLQELVRNFDENDFTELLKELEKSKNESGYLLSEKYNVINKNSQALGYSAYNYTMFELPYYWRCKYFHGNKSTTLFMAFSDPEYNLLKIVTYLLHHYLKEEIPQMFTSDFLKDKYPKILKYVESIK